MTSTLEEILDKALKRVNPSESEIRKIHELAGKLRVKVEKAAKDWGLETDVRIEGSVAKNTWLRDHPEIDVFIQLPTNTPREIFKTTCLEIARKATKAYDHIERFAEHPYLEVIVDNVLVNIVPCYKVKIGDWISSTDRTPFHTDYIKPLLNEKMAEDVRLLKRFMKGVEVCGAEIKVGGFSGYVCELLILNYGSFVDVLRFAANWKEKIIIDYAKHFKRIEDAENNFIEPIVVVDPVDKARNVSAAVRKERLDLFIAASRAFLKNPDIKFFYPQETKNFNFIDLTNRINDRGSTIIFIKFNGISLIQDVLWGQLYRSLKSLRKIIKKFDFTIIRDTVWSNEKDLSIFLFEIENGFLPNMKKHWGPPIRKRQECQNFLKKHVGAESTVSGPRIEDGHWVVDKKRKYTDIVTMLREKLKNGGKSEGVAELVSRSLVESFEVLVNNDVLNVYSMYPDFAKFLTEYLEGKPIWLS